MRRPEGHVDGCGLPVGAISSAHAKHELPLPCASSRTGAAGRRPRLPASEEEPGQKDRGTAADGDDEEVAVEPGHEEADRQSGDA